MKHKHISVILFCLYLGAVAVLCFARGEQLPDMPTTWFGIPADKIAHMLMFLPFPILSYQAFHPYRTGVAGQYGLLAMFTAAGAALAFATEKLQGILEYRSYELADLAADGIGLAAGAAVCAIYIYIHSKRSGQ